MVPAMLAVEVWAAGRAAIGTGQVGNGSIPCLLADTQAEREILYRFSAVDRAGCGDVPGGRH